MTYQVAALYVDPRGPYPGLTADWWDEARDARNYAGPLPIVAHPPCGPWSSLRHQYRGGGKNLAVIAVEQVRRWGGVLEHPATSRLWPELGLPAVGDPPDSFGGMTIEVEQVRWGHPARKLTKLYLVRTTAPIIIPNPREPTHWCSGGGSGRGKTPPGIKVCSAQQRRRTPPAFAHFLLRLAESARQPAVPALGSLGG